MSDIQSQRAGMLKGNHRPVINGQWERYRLAVHPLVHRENCGDL